MPFFSRNHTAKTELSNFQYHKKQFRVVKTRGTLFCKSASLLVTFVPLIFDYQGI
jgi:hypothetical protein